MIFLDQKKLPQESSISHYSSHHSPKKTIHYVKEIPSPSQLPNTSYWDISASDMNQKAHKSYTEAKKYIKKRLAQVFRVY